jgi:hypothetical protein
MHLLNRRLIANGRIVPCQDNGADPFLPPFIPSRNLSDHIHLEQQTIPKKIEHNLFAQKILFNTKPRLSANQILPTPRLGFKRTPENTEYGNYWRVIIHASHFCLLRMFFNSRLFLRNRL